MAGKKAEYEGWLPMNTFSFFGHLALSIGKAMPSQGDEVLMENNNSNVGYRKIICKDGKLIGAAFIDTDLNAGTLQYLIKKRVDIGKYRQNLIKAPEKQAYG